MSAENPEVYVDPFTGERISAPAPINCTPEEVDCAVAKIPRFERRILVLHRIDGLSFQQIAERERISVRRVEKALVKALTTFRHALKKMGKLG
ncbi:RNA polymerase sigma factor [Sphingomonas sp. PR090111-T3T-6A]|uniref:RNA polymerase sigma factor n=1 Tax=Sphingomonas sp. PR090111-T3T-6A TaxID=685778 RepID=UPI00035FBB70|nr:sigma factor-like helix-turn-helix DNA-binding protein [Sphingomonas sp. PR090111-T3T-6A]